MDDCCCFCGYSFHKDWVGFDIEQKQQQPSTLFDKEIYYYFMEYNQEKYIITTTISLLSIKVFKIFYYSMHNMNNKNNNHPICDNKFLVFIIIHIYIYDNHNNNNNLRI